MTETKDKISEIRKILLKHDDGIYRTLTFASPSSTKVEKELATLITESNRKGYKEGVKDFAKYLQNRLEPMKFVQNGVGYYRNKFLESLKDTEKEEE